MNIFKCNICGSETNIHDGGAVFNFTFCRYNGVSITNVSFCRSCYKTFMEKEWHKLNDSCRLGVIFDEPEVLE